MRSAREVLEPDLVGSEIGVGWWVKDVFAWPKRKDMVLAIHSCSHNWSVTFVWALLYFGVVLRLVYSVVA